MKQGLGWSSEGGDLVNVWEDNWIASSSIFKLFINRAGQFSNFKVSDLIDMFSNDWDMERVRDIFELINQERIEKTPIQGTTCQDCHIRMLDKKRDFLY